MAERKGGIPPIVTVLITISAIVAASLVAWFLYASTRSATQVAMLEVTSAYVVTSSTTSTVTATVRNIGAYTINVTSSSISVSCTTSSGSSVSVTGTANPTNNIPSGGSFVITATFTNPPLPKDGDSCAATLQVITSSGTQGVTLTFKLTSP